MTCSIWLFKTEVLNSGLSVPDTADNKLAWENQVLCMHVVKNIKWLCVLGTTMEKKSIEGILWSTY